MKEAIAFRGSAMTDEHPATEALAYLERASHISVA